jgi:hypothetical protein
VPFPYISYENDIDISTKILNYNRAMGIINQILKPSLVQKHTLIKVYKTLVRSILTYGSEAWTVRKSDRIRITTNEMKVFKNSSRIYKIK